MKNYGDITKIKGSEVPIVDIITGGSPCQDLSVAGKRAGLAGERSGLFMEQIRLIKEMRNEYRRTNDNGRNVSPRYMVWENVAGAFSSNKGEDFRAVLEEIAKVADENAIIPEPPKGKWAYAGLIVGNGSNGPYSICWRTHDSQWWGVPQRRRRLCVLADFNGLTAGKILFELRRETHDSHTKQTVMDTRKESRSEVQSESKGMSGDSESCRETREGTSEDAEGCSHTSGAAISFQERAGKPGGGKGILIQDERTGALSTLNNQPVCYGVVTKGNGDAFINPNTHTSLSIGGGQAGQGYPCVLENKCLNPWDVQSKHIQPEDGIAESLYSGGCRYGGGESYVLQNQQAMAMETFHCTSEVEKVQTLKARDYKDPQVVVLNDQGGQQMNISKDVTATLRAEEHGHQPIVFEPGAASRVGGHVYEDGITGTVRANAGDNQQAIVYGICSDGSNSMKSSNPYSGIYEADTSRTLDLNGGNPACNQGGMAVVQGVDVYNGELTGDKAVTVTAAVGGTNTSGPKLICLEGNGARESHKGDGYKESETMYTLNTVEQHAVCHTYRKKGHPQNSEQGQGWEETDVNDTLNVYDNSETRTPTIIVKEAVCIENHPADSRVKISEDSIVQTLSGRMGTGGGNVPLVMEVQEPILLESNQNHATVQTDGVSTTLPASMGMGGGYVPMVVDTYQDTTGALCASGYDKLGTQEAMNDMYVVQSSNWDGTQVAPTLTANNANGAQRMPDKDNFNAVVQTYKKKNNAGEYDSGIGTLKASGGDYGGGSETLVTTYQDTTGTICEAISKGTSNQIAEQDQLITNSIVRRLTPLECERLQGFPVVRKVKFTEMTKDEYIAWNLAEGNIIADVNTGRVYSTRGPGGVKLDNPRELKGSNLKGYLVVNIRNGETKMQCRIHRIIWIAAHGIIPDGYVIDHINNDKADNRLENLQLLTPGENSTKARNDDLYKIHEDAGAAKITDEVHDFIQHLYSTTDLTCRQMADIFGISKSRIHQIIHDEAWTNIGEWEDEKGKKHKNADSHRYKALGNSIALPFWQWLADRITAQLKEDGVENSTMASLFDGIGGFPLVFSRSGCKPMWISEIEDFPIAVTRVRFPNEELN